MEEAELINLDLNTITTTEALNTPGGKLSNYPAWKEHQKFLELIKSGAAEEPPLQLLQASYPQNVKVRLKNASGTPTKLPKIDKQPHPQPDDQKTKNLLYSSIN